MGAIDQKPLFKECSPDHCTKNAEYEELLTRFAEFVFFYRLYGSCPAKYDVDCLISGKKKRCKDAKQRVECLRQWIIRRGDVAERTDYQQAMLDGKEKMR